MNINTDQNIKYILYARKSTESEDKQASSIEDQVNEMKCTAKRLGIKIVDTITESKSAKKPGRKSFNKMLEKIHAGKADGILCWKLNRLARNPVDGGQISWMLQQGHIKHIQTYSSDYKPTDNVLMMQVEFGMANQYVNDLSVDVRRGMRTKAQRGWYPIAHLALGYKHNQDDDTKKITEIVPDKHFDAVRALWDLMLTGEYSVSDIMRTGAGKGLKNKRTGKNYSRASYYFILSNEFYAGYYYWYDENRKKIRMKGKHKTMVTEAEFNKVQSLLGKKGRPTRVNKCDFPFRGPLYCGECPCSVTAEHKLQAICTKCKFKFSMKRRTDCPKCNTDISEMTSPTIVDKTYYRCTKKKGLCSQMSITEHELEEQIEAELEKIHIPHDFYKWAVNALKDLHAKETDTNVNESVRLKKLETEVLQRIDNLVTMRANNEIDAEQMKKARDKADEELENLRREIRIMHEHAIDWLDIANQYLTFAEKAPKKFKNASNERKRAILGTLGSNLVLKDRKLIITTTKPLFAIQKLHNKANEQILKLEPKKSLAKQSSFECLDPKSPVLCAE